MHRTPDVGVQSPPPGLAGSAPQPTGPLPPSPEGWGGRAERLPADYERDVIAWADEQARFLRARQFDRLDLEHLAEEIEDVGKSEQRELASRLALLLMHLLKWQLQPERRGNSWRLTIREQRRALRARLARTPSLKAMLRDPSWWDEIWADALAAAAAETGLATFPEQCPWPTTDILDPDWMPETP